MALKFEVTIIVGGRGYAFEGMQCHIMLGRLKYDRPFSDLPVSIVLQCQCLSRMMILPLHVRYIHACMPAESGCQEDIKHYI